MASKSAPNKQTLAPNAAKVQFHVELNLLFGRIWPAVLHHCNQLAPLKPVQVTLFCQAPLHHYLCAIAGVCLH